MDGSNGRVGGLAEGGRPLSLRLAYPVVGVILALSLTLGLVAVRMLTNDASSPSTLLDELAASAFTYAYVFVANASLLGFLGYGLGAREDLLWATSITDPLTQIANRRHFEVALEDELARAQTSRMPLALLIADLDHLKTINDVGGHSAGDAALRTLADVIAKSSRARDLTARFGGDEFVIVMPRTRATEAWSLAERIRGSLEIEWSESPHRAKTGPLTVSIGIADLDATGDEVVSSGALFDAADRALYLAKGSGRDRAVVASQLDDTLVSARPQLLDAMNAAMGHTHPTPDAEGAKEKERMQTLRRSELSPETPPAVRPLAEPLATGEAAEGVPPGSSIPGPAIGEPPASSESIESVRAPGAAPTFCDETRTPCFVGPYDVPECEADRPRVGDISGVRAVVDIHGMPMVEAAVGAPRDVMSSIPEPYEAPEAPRTGATELGSAEIEAAEGAERAEETQHARSRSMVVAVPPPRESGAAPVYPIGDRQSVDEVEELIADTWDGWPEQLKRSS